MQLRGGERVRGALGAAHLLEKRAANQWDGAEGCFELDTLMQLLGLGQGQGQGFRLAVTKVVVRVCVTPVNITSSESG